MTLLLIWSSIAGVGLPLLVALAANWHDLLYRNDRPVLRAPRHRQPLTVIIYHTNLTGTRDSLRALRRLTSLPLDIIVIVPTQLQEDTRDLRRLSQAYSNVHIHYKAHRASRELTIRSCYRYLSPSAAVLILDSGDIASAATIHSALRFFSRNTTITTIYIEKSRHLAPTLPSMLALLMTLAKQTLYNARASLHLLPRHTFCSGSIIRSGYQLRLQENERCHYSRTAPIIQATTPHVPALQPLAFILMGLCLTAIGLCYYLAASLQTAQPLILVWVLCGWWAIVTMSTWRPARRTDPLLLTSIIPLMGIIAPSAALISTLAALRHWLTLLLRQSLAWTRRQHSSHGIFFGSRHP